MDGSAADAIQSRMEIGSQLFTYAYRCGWNTGQTKIEFGRSARVLLFFEIRWHTFGFCGELGHCLVGASAVRVK